MRLAGQTAVVTGAGSGIGKAIAVAFAHEGANVVAADYFEKAAQQCQDEIRADGCSCTALRADVTQTLDVDAVVTTAVREYGQLDIMANIAGIFDQSTPCVETTEGLWDRVMSVDLKGVFLGTRRALIEMLPREAGNIINMASVASFVAGGGGLSYTTAKAAIAGLTRQVAFEVAAAGIRVNALAPGLVHTNLFDTTSQLLTGVDPGGPLAAAAQTRLTSGSLAAIPMARGAEPGEIASAAVFLASPESSYITGHVLVVDGGYVLA